MDIFDSNTTHTEASVSSLDIADLTGREHRSVKRTIGNLVKKGIIQPSQTAKVENKQATSNNSKSLAYIFSGEQGKRDSIVVVARIMPEVTARIVDRWQELEERLAQPELPDFSNPVVAARAWADEYEARVLAEKTYLTRTVERDEAIRKRALIGSTREATAMARASVASRRLKKATAECARLRVQRDRALAVQAVGEPPQSPSRRAVGAFLIAHGINLPPSDLSTVGRQVARAYRAKYQQAPSQIWPESSKYPANVYPEAFLLETLSALGVLGHSHHQPNLI